MITEAQKLVQDLVRSEKPKPDLWLMHPAQEASLVCEAMDILCPSTVEVSIPDNLMPKRYPMTFMDIPIETRLDLPKTEILACYHGKVVGKIENLPVPEALR